MSGSSVDQFLNGLNKEQRQAVVETDGPILIVAGAGLSLIHI